MSDETSHQTVNGHLIRHSKKMGEIQKSLRGWAQFFGIPYGTFKGWAYKAEKRSPFFEEDARLIAAYGAGKALKARGNATSAGQKNYTAIMEKLNND